MDNLLFYGGLAVALLAVIAAAIIFVAHKAAMAKLNRKLDDEYGSVDVKKK